MRVCMTVFTDLRFDYRVYREARILADAGYEVTVVGITFKGGPCLEGWEGIKVLRIPLRKRSSLKLQYGAFWLRLFFWLRKIKAHVFHAHDLDALLPTFFAAKMHRAKLVYDSHEYWTEMATVVSRRIIRSIWRTMERLLIRGVDRTITVSPSIAEALSEQYALRNLSVLRNIPYYRRPEESSKIRSLLQIPEERKILLYQGGMLFGNGLENTIDAMKHINGAVLVLLGDGPMEGALKEKVRSEELSDCVKFLPRVPFQELHSYTCSAHIGLCAIKGTGKSFYFSSPNKLFEYLMAGLPVIASDFPEMRKVVLGAKVGLVVDPEDIDALRWAMTELLNNEERHARCRRRCLAVAQKYCWEKEAPKLVALYKELR